MSTKSDERLKVSLESHAATLNEYLDTLELALANADNARLQREIIKRIERYTRELARVHRDLAAVTWRLEKGR